MVRQLSCWSVDNDRRCSCLSDKCWTLPQVTDRAAAAAAKKSHACVQNSKPPRPGSPAPPVGRGCVCVLPGAYLCPVLPQGAAAGPWRGVMRGGQQVIVVQRRCCTPPHQRGHPTQQQTAERHAAVCCAISWWYPRRWPCSAHVFWMQGVSLGQPAAILCWAVGR